MGRISRVVPKQWTQYQAIGSIIPGTRFVPFKTPLNPALGRKVPKDKRFDVNDLLRAIVGRSLNLGLVIDLTDTDRYYERDDIEKMCIPYEKINCPGRGFIEREELVDSFNTVVENFMEENADNDLVIGVHCTNGVNRCGYLICRYLVERLDWTSHDAIDTFERARGYPIERGSYVQALHRAAKERRNKKRHKREDEVLSSDDELQRKRRGKHKRKRKAEPVSGDENGTPDPLAMEAVLSQMAIAFEKHQSLSSLPHVDFSGKWNVDGTASTEFNSQSSHHASADDSPYIGSNGTIEQFDDEDDDDAVVDQEYQLIAEEGETDATLSKKRRERRQRLRREFDLMKTGNFWKINEMQKEKLKRK